MSKNIKQVSVKIKVILNQANDAMMTHIIHEMHEAAAGTPRPAF